MHEVFQSEPLVTIVIPVYNGSNYLKEAIDSALSQTYSNIEVIVVNDGSRDEGKTCEVALSYGDKIRYIESKENRGVAAALNLAIKNMSGEYFSWLSHDDLYYPDKIECQIKSLRIAGDMTLPVYSNWDCLEMPLGRVFNVFPLDKIYSSRQLESGLFAVVMGLISGCSLLIHKSIFDGKEWFNENLATSQDYDMWFRLFYHRRLVYVNKALIQSRSHSEQGTYTNPVFQKECDELHSNMMKNMDKLEIEYVFETKYQFYSYMILQAANKEWKDSKRHAYEKFLQEDEPMHIGHKRQLLLNKIKSIYQKSVPSICLYGGGERGRFIIKNLMLRDIAVRCFADSNSHLWGKKIEGIECIAPDEIDKNGDLVIITPLCGFNLIRDTLAKKGITNVIAWGEIEAIIYHIPIEKNKLIQQTI